MPLGGLGTVQVLESVIGKDRDLPDAQLDSMLSPPGHRNPRMRLEGVERIEMEAVLVGYDGVGVVFNRRPFPIYLSR